MRVPSTLGTSSRGSQATLISDLALSSVALIVSVSGLLAATPAVAAASVRRPLGISNSCPGISVYPSPGTLTASPVTQISFRDVDPDELTGATVTVSGSVSGVHRGRWVADSDHRGASFYPSQPFDPGEVVTVATPYIICGAGSGAFKFAIARKPMPLHSSSTRRSSSSGTQPTKTYETMPGVPIPLVSVSKPAHFGGKFVFEAPKGGTKLGGAEILNGEGQPVWFHQLPAEVSASDFKIATFHGRPVLTFWKGKVTDGHGVQGEGVIMNSAYQVIATVQGGNGYSPDLHQFTLEPNGTAWLTAFNVVGWNLKSVGGPRDGATLDCIVQEIGVRTGNVLFEWHSLGHVPVSRSYQRYSSNADFDYFHVNSIDPLPEGTVLISSRNTDAAYDVAVATGRVQWTLGGKKSSFAMGEGARFRLQHDVELHSTHTVSVFDDEYASPSRLPARAIVLNLNYRSRTATLQAVYHHHGLTVNSQGNVQLLPDGGAFVGWGQAGWTSEYSRSRRSIFEMRFKGTAINSYRAYLLHWVGTPSTRPAVVTKVLPGGGIKVYVSWNGSTQTRRWEVLGGGSPNSLHKLATVPSEGFQTAVKIGVKPNFIKVVAKGARGRTLASSRVV